MKLTENELSTSIEPIRKMFLAQILFEIFENGVYDALFNGQNSLEEISKKFNFCKYRLSGVLDYLEYEGIITIDDDKPYLTDKGISLGVVKPWYQLLVGGYGKTFLDLTALLKHPNKYGVRNGEFVGIGSCGISQYDAIPMTKRLLKKIPVKIDYLIDTGCGDGSYLVNLCKDNPLVYGIGIDPNEKSINIAKQIINFHNLNQRVSFQTGNFNSLPKLIAADKNKQVVFVFAFMLQEVLEQSGENTIVRVLKKIKNTFYKSNLIIIEVDSSKNNRKIKSELGLSYYNAYNLIHKLTKQKLETIDFWEKIFIESGWSILCKVFPEKDYDSLELKVGFLLE